MEDYYKILEVGENCSFDEIKQAYRRLAKKYHPDINKAANAHQKFIEINEAYEVLQKRVQQASSPQQDQNTPTAQEYDEFIRTVREHAKRQANMRYQKFAKQHEAFRESGLQDLVLLFKYTGRILLPIIGLSLIAVPIVICFNEKSILPFLYLFVLWVMGGFILFDAFLKRKQYFNLGKFYYSVDKIIEFYTHTNDVVQESCFFCNGQKANSWPYIINMIKVKDIKLKNLGPMQHQAGFDRVNLSLKLPRSQKAFIVHSVSTAIKILSILSCLIFLPIDSLVWSFITGAILGFLISSLVLLFTRTSSKNAYLFSYGMIIKIGLWIGAISLCSTFDIGSCNINTNGYIRFVFFTTIFIDAVVEQILKMSTIQFFKPILKRYKNMSVYFDKNYQLYLEIPGWTTIYPVVRWIF